MTKMCLTLYLLTELAPAGGVVVDVVVAGGGAVAGTETADGVGEDAGKALGDGPPEFPPEPAGEVARGELGEAPRLAPSEDTSAGWRWITTRR